MNGTCDKATAIILMRRGNKMTHPYFSDNEWVTMQGNQMVFENGVKMWESDFWKDRHQDGWNENWSIFKP